MTPLDFLLFGLAFAGSLLVVGCVGLVLFSLYLVLLGTAAAEAGRRR